MGQHSTIHPCNPINTCTFHTRTLLSAAPVMRRSPSAVTAIHRTHALCPMKQPLCFPVATSHLSTVLSAPPLKAMAPSGLMATHQICAVCPFKVARRAQLSKSCERARGRARACALDVGMGVSVRMGSGVGMGMDIGMEMGVGVGMGKGMGVGMGVAKAQAKARAQSSKGQSRWSGGPVERGGRGGPRGGTSLAILHLIALRSPQVQLHCQGSRSAVACRRHCDLHAQKSIFDMRCRHLTPSTLYHRSLTLAPTRTEYRDRAGEDMNIAHCRPHSLDNKSCTLSVPRSPFSYACVYILTCSMWLQCIDAPRMCQCMT